MVAGKKEQRKVTKRDDRAERPIRADAQRKSQHAAAGGAGGLHEIRSGRAPRSLVWRFTRAPPAARLFRERLRPALQDLLGAAASPGSFRAGVDPYDLLAAVASLGASTRDGDDPARARCMIGLLDGLRYDVERG